MSSSEDVVKTAADKIVEIAAEHDLALSVIIVSRDGGEFRNTLPSWSTIQYGERGEQAGFVVNKEYTSVGDIEATAHVMHSMKEVSRKTLEYAEAGAQFVQHIIDTCLKKPEAEDDA